MKVLHVIPWVGLKRGGPSQEILQLVPAQNQLGIQSEIITTNDDGPGLLDVPLGDVTEYRGAPVRFFPRWSPKPSALREFVYCAPLAGWLSAHAHEYDLLHVHGIFNYVSTVGMRIARQQGRPYLNRPHGMLCEWSLRRSALRKKIYLALAERANLNGSLGLTCTAEQEIEEARLVHLRPPSIVLPCGLHLPPLVPNACDRLREKYSLPKDRPIILFLSRLHPKKGLDLLLDALETMTDVDFTFIAAGSGEPDYEKTLRTRVQMGPLAGRVLMPGFAEGADKDLLLQGADIFALTSHSESFAIAVLEAMAVGLPAVISCTIPLASIVIKHGLGVVTNLEPSQIAAALRAQLKKPRDEARATHSRDLVQRNFTWDIIARRSLEVYEAALQKKPLPSWELAAV